MFEKRAELVNSYPSYTKTGDDDRMMWHAGSSWYVGLASNLGEASGVVAVFDGALTPESATVTCQMDDGDAGQLVDVPDFRCILNSEVT